METIFFLTLLLEEVCDRNLLSLLYQQRLICSDNYVSCCILETYICQVELQRKSNNQFKKPIICLTIIPRDGCTHSNNVLCFSALSPFRNSLQKWRKSSMRSWSGFYSLNSPIQCYISYTWITRNLSTNGIRLSCGSLLVQSIFEMCSHTQRLSNIYRLDIACFLCSCSLVPSSCWNLCTMFRCKKTCTCVYSRNKDVWKFS